MYLYSYTIYKLHVLNKCVYVCVYFGMYMYFASGKYFYFQYIFIMGPMNNLSSM